MSNRLAFALAAALACAALPVRAAAQPNPEFIRVAIVRGDEAIQLQIHGRFTIFTLQTSHPIQQGRRMEATPVRAVPGGIMLGGEVLPVNGVRIEAESQAAISLNGKRLRGALEIRKQKNQTLLVINHVDLEDYLRGVLSKEVPDYWPPEALKTVAIAARTYAVYQRLTKAPAEYDVTADVMSQDYGGKSHEKAATTRAVKATAGLIILNRGRLFPTFYHSTCGGITENGRAMGKFDLEPLRGGVVCNFCQASPFYRWQRRLTKADLNWALKKSKHGQVGTILDLRVTRRTPTGRAEEIAIVGVTRTLRISGFDLRALLGFEHIRSPFFSVAGAGDAFLLDGRGWGHGVGLCQFGTSELARRGLSAREILAYYYPGTELVSLTEAARTPIEIIGGS